jgi:hypothetical protein
MASLPYKVLMQLHIAMYLDTQTWDSQYTHMYTVWVNKTTTYAFRKHVESYRLF